MSDLRQPNCAGLYDFLVEWLTAYQFPEDFEDLRNSGAQADVLARELLRELPPVHELSGQKWSVIAKAIPQGEIVLELDDDRVALVHLTWSKGPEQAPYPLTTFVSSQSEFETLASDRY